MQNGYKLTQFINNMQRLTSHSMPFEVRDLRVCYILNKSENATPELFAIDMQNDAASIANESVSEC